MTLDEYMKAEGLRDQDMAVRIGRDRSTVSRIRRGITAPSAKVLAQIRAATNNQVTPDDFFATNQEAA